MHKLTFAHTSKTTGQPIYSYRAFRIEALANGFYVFGEWTEKTMTGSAVSVGAAMMGIDSIFSYEYGWPE